MFVIVYSPRDNETHYLRRMGPHEVMDARKFADKIAAEFEAEIDEPNGHIPAGSGDLRVEFRPHKFNADVIWSGEDFYFKRQD